MPPAATHRVTGKRAAMPDATVSLLKREFPRFPCSAALSQIQYWAKKPSFRWSCAVILAISAGVALVPPARATAGLPGMIRMSEIDAEGDEEQQQNGDEQPTRDERQEGAATGRHCRRLAQPDPVRRHIVQSPVVLVWPTTGATS